MEGLAARGKTVKALEDVPEVWEHNEPYIEAFNRLSKARPAGMGLTPIPADEIRLYMEVEGVEDERRFVAMIRALDSAWLEFQAERLKEAKE